MKSKKLKVKGNETGFAFHFSLFTFHFSLSCIVAIVFFSSASAQKIAVLTPDKTESSREFADRLAEQLSVRTTVLDFSLAESAYVSVSPPTPFNLTAEESKRLGAAIGCDFIILTRAATQRRSSFHQAEYYEAYSVIYLVSARSGRLVLWTMPSFEAARPSASEMLLSSAILRIATKIVESMRSAVKEEIAESDYVPIEEVPEENSSKAKNFRVPAPYRRLKPDYTSEAGFYNITATIEILVDLDADGTILRTRIVRWAGYGLDESVEKTVRAMNWLPAARNGKQLPVRFLLRYNFKKLEK